MTSLAGTRLRMELDSTPLWRGDQVAIRQLAEDFARYIYLPRLRDTEVLLSAIRDGLGLLLWEHESFAYADGFDEVAQRYRGLRCGESVQLVEQFGEGLLVKPEVALRQREADKAPATSISDSTDESGTGEQSEAAGQGSNGSAEAKAKPKRYYGTVKLDAVRVGRDAGQIAEEVIAHLSGLVGATVTVTLEIEAIAPDGVPDNVVRTITENSRTLKFTSHGFEDGIRIILSTWMCRSPIHSETCWSSFNRIR